MISDPIEGSRPYAYIVLYVARPTAIEPSQSEAQRMSFTRFVSEVRTTGRRECRARPDRTPPQSCGRDTQAAINANPCLLRRCSRHGQRLRHRTCFVGFISGPMRGRLHVPADSHDCTDVSEAITAPSYR
jgi:hypothetical protein